MVSLYHITRCMSNISVALCTCNGAHYIEHQLESIRQQQLPVDEIVVCDDLSSDETISVIRHFKKASGIDVRIVINNPRLGVCGNFDKAIRLCSGDIIFLCDQDDLWLPEKTKCVMEWFKENPDKDVVFTNGYFMDNQEQSFTQRTLFAAVGFTTKAQMLFDKGFQLEAFLQHNRATGATMALRKSFLSYIQIDVTATNANGKPLHDHVIALAAASLQRLGYISRALIRYRIHDTQECGFGNWIKKPPTNDDLAYPIHAKKEYVNCVLPQAKERACFGTERQRYRRLTHKSEIIANRARYKELYGTIGCLPLLKDLFWLGF